MFLQEDLIRILSDHLTGTLILNPDKFKNGRSIYVCKKPQCIETLKTNKRYKAKAEYQEIFKKIKI